MEIFLNERQKYTDLRKKTEFSTIFVLIKKSNLIKSFQ